MSDAKPLTEQEAREWGIRENMRSGLGASNDALAFLFSVLDALRASLAECERERDEARNFIERRGYRRCDVGACNCGSWHEGTAETRLREVIEERDRYKAEAEAAREAHNAAKRAALDGYDLRGKAASATAAYEAIRASNEREEGK